MYALYIKKNALRVTRGVFFFDREIPDEKVTVVPVARSQIVIDIFFVLVYRGTLFL